MTLIAAGSAPPSAAGSVRYEPIFTSVCSTAAGSTAPATGSSPTCCPAPPATPTTLTRIRPPGSSGRYSAAHVEIRDRSCVYPGCRYHPQRRPRPHHRPRPRRTHHHRELRAALRARPGLDASRGGCGLHAAGTAAVGACVGGGVGLGRLVFSGQLINFYIMLRTAGSGTRRRPLAGSGIRALSADVEYCSGIRCTGQCPFGRVRGWGRRCG